MAMKPPLQVEQDLNLKLLHPFGQCRRDGDRSVDVAEYFGDLS
jgi:hypothetical protein